MRVIIYENKGSTQEEVAQVFMDESDQVTITGDKDFIDQLEQDGIKDYSSEESGAKVFPPDGESFMRNLIPFFSSGHLNAVVQGE